MEKILAGVAGQIFPDLLPRGPGLRETQFRGQREGNMSRRSPNSSAMKSRSAVSCGFRSAKARKILQSNCQGVQQWTPFLFDNVAGAWEIAHMTTLVKADSRGRVPIRGTKSRQQYLVTAEKGGWWVMPAPKTKIRPANWRMSWPTLEKTRPAPEIDYDKI